MQFFSNVWYKPNKIYNFVYKVFPLVDAELSTYINSARLMPDNELSKQALDSISTKKFHCQGGSIYALYPYVDTRKMIQFVVAYQTISDYLDNLCDRVGLHDEKAFKCLHYAVIDALTADNTYSDYYRYYPYSDDGDYLKGIVRKCKGIIADLPSYVVIKDKILYLAGLYSDLQVYKHLSEDAREGKLKDWFNMYVNKYPDINGWEFAAASGSTLGIFVLVAAAFNKDLTKNEVESIFQVYFPWVCGLHILLDYYIDLYDDLKSDDLNFVSYYRDEEECIKRLKHFYTTSLTLAKGLNHAPFHCMVIDGLLAMYLSDPKADIKTHLINARDILHSSGYFARILYCLCKRMRSQERI
jgi:Protein of unknown function (DUF2600).